MSTFPFIAKETTKMKPQTILAFHRLAATLDVDTARIEAGVGDHVVDEVVQISGTVRLGEDYLAEDTSISWQVVAGFLLANMGDQRRVVRNQIIRAIENDDLSSLDVGRARRARKTLRTSVAKAKGSRRVSGKITGKLAAKSIVPSIASVGGQVDE
jgi:hypothetical protein